MDTHIRAERPEDAAAVDDILVQAFGRTYEADLVIRLREGGRACLALLAEKDGQAVGHILFSPLALEGYTPPHAPDSLPDPALAKAPAPWPGVAPGSICLLALAPVAVLPAFKHQGIGGLLIKQGLLAAGPLGRNAARAARARSCCRSSSSPSAEKSPRLAGSAKTR